MDTLSHAGNLSKCCEMLSTSIHRRGLSLPTLDSILATTDFMQRASCTVYTCGKTFFWPLMLAKESACPDFMNSNSWVNCDVNVKLKMFEPCANSICNLNSVQLHLSEFNFDALKLKRLNFDNIYT